MKYLKFKVIFAWAWVVGILFIAFGAYLFWMVFSVGINEDFVEIYKTHFTALVGVPAAAFFQFS